MVEGTGSLKSDVTRKASAGRSWGILSGLAVLLVLLMLTAASVGAYPISLFEGLGAIFRFAIGGHANDPVDTVLLSVVSDVAIVEAFTGYKSNAFRIKTTGHPLAVFFDPVSCGWLFRFLPIA